MRGSPWRASLPYWGVLTAASFAFSIVDLNARTLARPPESFHTTCCLGTEGARGAGGFVGVGLGDLRRTRAGEPTPEEGPRHHAPAIPSKTSVLYAFPKGRPPWE